MRRFVLACLIAILLFPLLPLSGGVASAHPLGNFTVNHVSRITVGVDGISVRYVLDLAEIPTLQELQAGRAGEALPAQLAAALFLRVEGVAVPLAIESATIEQLAGQAGLTTLRVVIDLRAAARDGARIEYQDATYPGRIGWHAVLIAGGVRGATVPASDPTNELRTYPADATAAPPDVTAGSATVDFAAASGAGTNAAPPIAGVTRFAIDLSADALTGFLRRPGTDIGALLAALIVAAILGAFHALGPGHGKAMVAAYLVGSRGTAAQAVVLGTTVTVTHTVGVYALGAITLVAAQFILPERLYPILGALSGVTVSGLGLAMLRARVRSLRVPIVSDNAHGHEHGDGPGQHSHVPQVGTRGLLALGVSGGILPCPTALVVLLAAVSFHNVVLGMILVAAFSLGLAGVLTVVGLAVVWGRRAISRNRSALALAGSRGLRLVPAASAAAIAVAGLVIAIGAVRGLA